MQIKTCGKEISVKKFLCLKKTFSEKSENIFLDGGNFGDKEISTEKEIS